MRILIIEDNLDNCLIYQDMLDGIDADIAVCHTTEKPLHTLMQFLPDIVLLDLGLPKAFAEVVLGFVHSNPQLAHTQVIILSDDRFRASYTARHWGLAFWLHKPILQTHLYKAIGAVSS
jgi:DNA-binding response OmpR family regulator